MFENDEDDEGKMSAEELQTIEKMQLVSFTELGFPHFPVCDDVKKGQLASRREVNNIIQTVCKMESIDLADFAELTAIGNGMAFAKDSCVSHDACAHINKASWDCAVLARKLLDKAGADRESSFKPGGQTIAAGMDVCHNCGHDACNHYEVFHSGIMAIPTGVCGKTFKEVFALTTLFKRHRSAHMAQLKEITCNHELRPDAHDEFSLIAFAKKDGEPNAAKRKMSHSPGLPKRKKPRSDQDTA